AFENLKYSYNASGRLNKVTYLYDMMDNDNIDFSLVFGHQEFNKSENKQNLSKQVPWGVGLSYLDLSFNKLNEIPYSLSLLGNLQTVNLSHNRISGLYRDWICWRPPVQNGTGKNRHCYWFRASAQTLKVLDLSYNRIELIGEIQPWYNVQLAELHLQGNQITTINPEAFAKSRLKGSLVVLNLDYNKLMYFLLSSLERLEEISIQHNQLGNVENDSLPRSSQLHRVKLANNCITAIETGAFNNLKMLDFIDLSHNQLLHIYYDSMTMTKRTTLGSR
uniref:LRRCT domain-containing protein n=1 Tax=Macrostomum lignano TaxID=282301 RepID=A0A1I8JAV5_9PLAT